MNTGESRSSLRELLRQLPFEILREIARQRGWSIGATDKASYASSLAPLLGDPTSVARTVITLPDDLREALRAAFVIEDGHGIAPDDLAGVITALRGDDEPYIKPVEAARLLVDLANRGLLLPWDTLPGATTYLFPWEIQVRVPRLPGWCPGLEEDQAKHALPPEQEDFAELLSRLWKHLAVQRPKLRPRTQPEVDEQAATLIQDWPLDPGEIQRWERRQRSKRRPTPRSLTLRPPQMLLDDEDMDRLTQLTGVESEKLEFALRLMLELNLAEVDDTRLVPRPDGMESFARGTPAEQRRTAAQAYMSMPSWSELDMLVRAKERWILTYNPYFHASYTQFRFGLARARQSVLRLLAVAGERRCCYLSRLEAALIRVWPHLFQPRKYDGAHPVANVLQLSLRQRPEAEGTEPCSAQAAFLRAMLFGPLQWLGYAQRCSQRQEPTAIRFNGLGNVLWEYPDPSRTVAAAEPLQFDSALDRITVQPYSVDPDVPSFLGQVAVLESADPDQFVYRLDMRAVHATFDRGKLLSELELEWQRIMPAPMPSGFHRALHEWWARYGSMRLYESFALVEVDDEVTLRELEATTSLREHIVARVSPRLVLIPSEQVDDLIREARKRGHMPRQVG